VQRPCRIDRTGNKLMLFFVVFHETGFRLLREDGWISSLAFSDPETAERAWIFAQADADYGTGSLGWDKWSGSASRTASDMLMKERTVVPRTLSGRSRITHAFGAPRREAIRMSAQA